MAAGRQALPGRDAFSYPLLWQVADSWQAAESLGDHHSGCPSQAKTRAGGQGSVWNKRPSPSLLPPPPSLPATVELKILALGLSTAACANTTEVLDFFVAQHCHFPIGKNLYFTLPGRFEDETVR